MKLEEAQKIAEKIKVWLAPFCERIEIAGSIRRRKAEVSDIEIVCIPRNIEATDMLGPTGKLIRDKDWSTHVMGIGRIVKGNPIDGKYINIDLGPIKLDIFTARPDNWGLILAIRTGNAEFSHRILACGWVRAGYHGRAGMLYDAHDVARPIREEADLFRLIGFQWVKPEDRI